MKTVEEAREAFKKVIEEDEGHFNESDAKVLAALEEIMDAKIEARFAAFEEVHDDVLYPVD